MNVAVWYPALPVEPTQDEADSFVQAESVARALAELGTRTVLLEFDVNDLAATVGRLIATGPDLVFNLVEEAGGDPSLDTLPPRILTSLGLPYTGNDATAITLTTHKVAAKEHMVAAGLPTPEWLTRGNGSGSPIGPFLIKPVCADASKGIDEADLDLVDDARAAAQLLKRENVRNFNGGERFAERYVDGREFNLSVVEIDGIPTVLPVAEIQFVDYPADKPRIVGYRAKWLPDSFEYQHSMRLFADETSEVELHHELSSLALRCWHVFGLRGYARVDFRVDASGQPWILEINANPGLAPDAGLAAAAQRAGLTYNRLVGSIVDAALS